jgi:hypothetical protein
MSKRKKRKKTGGVFSDLVSETSTTSTIPEQHLPTGCPASLDTLVGNTMTVQLIEKFASNPQGKVLVVWGPTGVGKTSVCRLACRNKAFVHDLRTIGTPLITKLKRLGSSKRHYANEVVLLDPLEEIVQSATDAQKICDAVAKAAVKSKLGFVLVMNDLYHKFMYPIRKHRQLNPTTIRFYRLRTKDIQLILMNLGVKKRSVINEGVRVADGDGRKARQFSETGGNCVDRLINKFEGCSALVSKKPMVARSADTHQLLNLWHANIPHIVLGPNNVDPTEKVKEKMATGQQPPAALKKKMRRACRDMQTYSEAMDNASFADIASTTFKTHDYALESTIAFAKSHRLHPLPRGGCEFPLPPFSQDRQDIKKKVAVLNTTPEELHRHVTTLIASINEPTVEARSKRTERIVMLNNLYKRYDISPEVGMYPLETSYRQRFGKKMHR